MNAKDSMHLPEQDKAEVSFYIESPASREDMISQYGFRDIHIDEKLNTEEVKLYLAAAYQAFKDLSTVLDIYSKDLSLGGRLAISFGEAGHWTGKASYDENTATLHMGSLSEAGSLSHEWLHAMDDLLRKQLYGTHSRRNPPNSSLNRLLADAHVKLIHSLHSTVVSGKKAVMYKELKLKQTCEEFKKTLDDISRENCSAEKETMRQDLISNVLEEALYNYSALPSLDAPSQSASADRRFYPSYGELLDFTKSYENDDLWECRNRKYIRNMLKEIGTLSDQVHNRPESISGDEYRNNFFRDALYLDRVCKHPGHGKWSSPEEMLARAGAAYIAELCKKAGIENTYLNGHAKGIQAVEERKDMPAYTHFSTPQGFDRKEIQNAFTRFFETMTTLGFFKKRQPNLPSLETAISAAYKKQENRISSVAETRTPVKLIRYMPRE